MNKNIMKLKFKLIVLLSLCLLLFACQNKNENVTVADDTSDIIETDYKKIDLSNFVEYDDLDGYIYDPDGGTLLSKAPCRVTYKANVKFERGPAMKEDEIGDKLLFRFSFADAYYADYENDFFDNFHEIKHTDEYFKGTNGNVFLSYLGINDVVGISRNHSNTKSNHFLYYQKQKKDPGDFYFIKYVYHDENEYVVDCVTIGTEELIIKVTVKDLCYKISKPTGTTSEWDLNKDFKFVDAKWNCCFDMRDVNKNYTYILYSDFTATINDKIKNVNILHSELFYITNASNVVWMGGIASGKDRRFTPVHNKIGIGVVKTEWYDSNNKKIDTNIKWDKDSKNFTVIDSKGTVLETIHFNYIKEYKYKIPEENNTPGREKYLIAINRK